MSGSDTTETLWSYCINPKCQQRLNPYDNQRCQACGSELLIAKRYRLLKPLRQFNPAYITEIFEAEDTREGTAKVLKVLTRHHPKLIELFRREADVLRRMKNPGIPKVDPIGCFTIELAQLSQPLYCLVMERIEGQDLQQWLMEHGAISQTLALRWLQQLAEILHEIHQNNLFHRDIKPSNIMLRPQGLWGQLVLIDFGTAREITETVIGGRDSTVVYSDGYTAPEQIRGRATPQSDFFALGRTFIHLLTNIHPNDFLEEDSTQNLRWQQRAPHIAPFLADLVTSLAADSVRDRPNNSLEFLEQLEDVRRQLDPQPLFAVPKAAQLPTPALADDEWITQLDEYSPVTRQQTSTRFVKDATQSTRWLDRYRHQLTDTLTRSNWRWLVGSAATAVLAIGLLGGSWVRMLQQRQQIVLSQRLLVQAETLQQQSGNYLDQSLLLGVEAWRRLESLGLSTLPAEQVLQTGLAQLPRSIAQLTHTDDVQAIAFSPDGTYFATASADHTAQIWNLKTQTLVTALQHEAGVNAIAFSPDSQLLATASADRSVQLWQPNGSDDPMRLSFDAEVTGVTFSPDSRLLAVSSGSQVILRSIAANAVVTSIQQPGFVTAVAFSPDGQWIAVATTEGTIAVRPVGTPGTTQTLRHQGSVNAIAFSPDSRLLLTGSDDQTARVWTVATGQEVRRLDHAASVITVAFSPDGTRLATATGSPLPRLQDQSMQVWDAATGRSIARMNHAGAITSLHFSPDGERLATSSFDGTAAVWDAATGTTVARMSHDAPVMSVAFSPDGRSIATASLDNTAQVWELIGNPVLLALAHPALVQSLAFSPDSDYLATSAGDRTIRIWDAATGAIVRQFQAASPVQTLVYSPDRQYLAVVSREQTVELWDPASGDRQLEIRHPGNINAVVFSPDSRYLATASADNTARVWETASGLEVARLTHDSFVEAVAFSPDAAVIATASLDNTARVWEWQSSTPREVARLSHDSFVEAIAFSPNGEWLATASLDNTARLWEWRSPDAPAIAQLQHDNDVAAIAFSPDGKYLATSSQVDLLPSLQENQIHLWTVPKGREVLQLADQLFLQAPSFSPDSQYLATVSRTEGAQIWQIPEGREVARLENSASTQAIAFSSKGDLAGVSEQQAWIWSWQSQDLITQTCDRLTQNLTVEVWQHYFGNAPYRPTCDR